MADLLKNKIQLEGFEFKEDTKSLNKIVKNNSKDKIELELGDSKDSTKLYPQAKIKRWNNEVNLSVRYKEDDSRENETVETKDKTLIWSKGKKEIHIYEKPEVGEDGGLELEVVLKEKPISNVIEFSIETEGLNFFKQPKASLFIDPVNVDYIVNEIKSYKPESVLDLGGNKGNVVKALNDSEIRATCLDNSKDGYDNKVTEDYIFVDLEKGIPLEDKSIDLITAYGTLPYISEDRIEFVLSEIVRVAKRAVISFNWANYPSNLGDILNWHEKDWYISKFKEIDKDFEVDVISIETHENILENVKGSYAVYHQTKAGNFPDKEYKTGKFCHIYRPLVKDADGKETWGELNIDINKKLLTVTVDDEWLKSAVYPVIVDPTFGYTSIGASSFSVTGLAGTTIYSYYNTYAGGAGTGQSMSIYTGEIYNPTGTGIQMAIYDSSNNLVDHTGTINPTTAGWHDADLVDNATLSSSNYYLYHNEKNTTGGADSQSFYIHYDANTGYRSAAVSSLGDWPSSISPSSSTKATYQFSIYATYTEGATIVSPFPSFFRS